MNSILEFFEGFFWADNGKGSFADSHADKEATYVGAFCDCDNPDGEKDTGAFRVTIELGYLYNFNEKVEHIRDIKQPE